MIYADDVVIYAFLNGTMLGYLNGVNSLKFDMPAADSVLVISYSNKEMHKLNIIDNFDLLSKPVNEYYQAEDMVMLGIELVEDYPIELTLDGEKVESLEFTFFTEISVYIFKMPEHDCEIVLLLNGFSDYSCENSMHLYNEGIKTGEDIDSYIIEYTCELCGYRRQERVTEIQLSTKPIYILNESACEEYQTFIDEFDLSNKRYLVIDNSEMYYKVYSSLPSTELELLSQEEADIFFEDNVIVLYLRYISGSITLAPVKYYYNIGDKSINKKYINSTDENTFAVYLGYAIDLITIPRIFYEELNK